MKKLSEIIGPSEPKNTVIGYKLFNKKGNNLHPLFISKNKPTPVGKWIHAEHIPTKGFAERPGWHSGSLPIAPHLRTKDNKIAPNRVWAEVSIPNDVDWQSHADKSKTKDIRYKVPQGGHYKFKTNKMQGGSWLISGAIKVNRILSNKDVHHILTKNGIDPEEAKREQHDKLNEITYKDHSLKGEEALLGQTRATEDTHQTLVKHYNFHSKADGSWPERNNLHVKHIENYTDDSSGVNNYLWMKHKKNLAPNKDELEFNAFKDSSPNMKHLDDALTRFKTPMDINVHAGTYFDPRHAKNSKGIVHHPGYLSTSLVPKKAEEFAPVRKPEKSNEMIPKMEKHVMNIHVPAGSHGAYVSHISANPKEREFILPRGSKLKYHHTETIPEESPHDGKYNKHIHHMTLVK